MPITSDQTKSFFQNKCFSFTEKKINLTCWLKKRGKSTLYRSQEKTYFYTICRQYHRQFNVDIGSLAFFFLSYYCIPFSHRLILPCKSNKAPKIHVCKKKMPNGGSVRQLFMFEYRILVKPYHFYHLNRNAVQFRLSHFVFYLFRC